MPGHPPVFGLQTQLANIFQQLLMCTSIPGVVQSSRCRLLPGDLNSSTLVQQVDGSVEGRTHNISEM